MRAYRFRTCCIMILCILTLATTVIPPGYAADVLSLTPVPAGCEVDRTLFLTSPPMQGPDVVELQEHLAANGYYSGTIDGVYGPLTARAVEQFQTAAGLVPDGVFRIAHWPYLLPHTDELPAQTTQQPPPADAELHLVVDTQTLQLTVYVDGEPFKTYPVAVGRPTRFTLSPIGEWRVINKGRWGGGFGTRWMGLNVPWGIYGIHGTNQPGSIGNRASAGCIRMFNHDVEELYEWVEIGTRVIIVGDPPPVQIGRRLQVGSTGEDVVLVQFRLQDLGLNAGGADGRYGPNTESAVRQLQRVYGFPDDGIVYNDLYYLLGLK